MRLVLLLVLSLLGSAASRAQDSLLLSSIPLTTIDSSDISSADQISFLYESTNASATQALLLKNTSLAVGPVENKQFEIKLKRGSVLPGTRLDKYLESSFVIDNEEEATQAFLKGFKARGARSGSSKLKAIVAYVSAYITNTTYIHNFHIASKVAQSRSGDCTEFAVLTTALARANDMQARIVNGIVFVEEESGVQAYGHSWSEVWLEDAWQVADAALYGLDNKKLFHLPIGALENEGPGFAMAMAGIINYFPERINQLRVDN